MKLGCVVEGQGDVMALPVLLRRMYPMLEVPKPVRLPRGRFGQRDELVRAVTLAAIKAGPGGPVLVMADADADCPVEAASTWTRWASEALAGGDRRISVVLPVCEFEAWFVAAARSLSGLRGLPEDLAPPPDPEGQRGAKEWIRGQMARGRTYKETVDQPAFAQLFDLDEAMTSRSFRKFRKDVDRLLS